MTQYVFVFLDAEGNECLRSYTPGAQVKLASGETKAQADVVVGDSLTFGAGARRVAEIRLVEIEE